MEYFIFTHFLHICTFMHLLLKWRYLETEINMIIIVQLENDMNSLNQGSNPYRTTFVQRC